MHTLKPFLATTAQLHSKVNIKMIIMALLDRLATYAQDEQGNFVESKDNALFIMFWNEIMELVKVSAQRLYRTQ
jgi:vacuolar protein sorting-associated protein 35